MLKKFVKIAKYSGAKAGSVLFARTLNINSAKDNKIYDFRFSILDFQIIIRKS